MHRYITILAILLLVGCTQEREGQQARSNAVADGSEIAERGKDIFYDAEFGYTGLACSDCHADYDDALEDGKIFAGHPILGAARRSQAWAGEYTGAALKSSAAGAAKCAHLYLDRGQNPDEALTGPEAAALLAFFAYISTGDEAPQLDWQAVTWPGDPRFDREAFDAEMEDVARLRGDVLRGGELFERACATCHGADRGPAPAMLHRKVDRIAATVRRGAEGMPFFSRDKLSDQDIADITAWIRAGAL